MEKWIISKEINFDYGHRVHTQVLDCEYSIDAQCACRHKHGHLGRVIVHLESTELNPQGMVVDFKMLNWFKKFIDDVIDHKFIVDREDPALFDMFLTKTPEKDFEFEFEKYKEGHWLVKPELNYILPHVQEIYEGYVIVPFVPTSENLCKWFHKIVQEKMNPLGVKVSRIQFYETPKSQSNYYG